MHLLVLPRQSGVHLDRRNPRAPFLSIFLQFAGRNCQTHLKPVLFCPRYIQPFPPSLPTARLDVPTSQRIPRTRVFPQVFLITTFSLSSIPQE